MNTVRKQACMYNPTQFFVRIFCLNLSSKNNTSKKMKKRACVKNEYNKQMSTKCLIN